MTTPEQRSMSLAVTVGIILFWLVVGGIGLAIVYGLLKSLGAL